MLVAGLSARLARPLPGKGQRSDPSVVRRATSCSGLGQCRPMSDRINPTRDDSTQAQLAQLAFALERVRSQLLVDAACAEGLLDGCIRDVNLAARDLCAILRDLIPQQLLGQTLQSSLQEGITGAREDYPAVDIFFQADSGIEGVLPIERQVALLRICQQASDNAVAHAQATEISIMLQPSMDHDGVEFAIADNGRGFVPRPSGELLEKGHHGLHIIEARALQHGGRVAVESTPGKGTVVKGFLPVG